jgi:hypothetical protein
VKRAIRDNPASLPISSSPSACGRSEFTEYIFDETREAADSRF